MESENAIDMMILKDFLSDRCFLDISKISLPKLQELNGKLTTKIKEILNLEAIVMNTVSQSLIKEKWVLSSDSAKKKEDFNNKISSWIDNYNGSIGNIPFIPDYDSLQKKRKQRQTLMLSPIKYNLFRDVNTNIVFRPDSLGNITAIGHITESSELVIRKFLLPEHIEFCNRLGIDIVINI